jgi:hypothetical protein
VSSTRKAIQAEVTGLSSYAFFPSKLTEPYTNKFQNFAFLTFRSRFCSNDSHLCYYTAKDSEFVGTFRKNVHPEPNTVTLKIKTSERTYYNARYESPKNYYLFVVVVVVVVVIVVVV